MAQDILKLDHKVQAAAREASKGLEALQSEIKSVLRKIDKGQVDKSKALAASNKLMAFMKKFIPVTKIQNSPAYDKLSPESQKQVDWIDQLLSDLLGTLTKLKAAKSDAAKTPKKDYAYLLKASERAYAGVPKGVGTLLKEIKKANDPNFPGAQGLSILPMAIILWMILDMISRNLKRRPKT